ncbi:hypothetical protein SDRG_09241 [Saprolegnia diclina VS20]|uniref:NADPH--hemoprotein reductase n=1 Tax=Saprolegnia diclina (strain VS20) TaxID=1156394 RepID=T0Q5V7_SAPDV|nr:hypothetical protein SDRG_09241 [Saprolegnia diclina VS20]EQC33259.1 hypothetical protein SDRG_09241 [Saprolegnia diclina VS20]|eukprot:XP_008613382.1 hypothetical protein SDRG_09241 [Saprolegnia diclina VS20]
MSGMFANLFGSMSLRKLTSGASMRSKSSIAPATTSRRKVSVRERFSPAPSARSSVADPPKPASLVIYYGSQTGRGEAFANRLVAAARRVGYAADMKDLYKFDPDDFVNEAYVIFILSAYMDGGATDNAAHFNFWINHQVDAKAARLLPDQQYAVFASGDSVYGDNFNLFGIAIDAKLSLLGSRRLLECTLGDASNNLDTTYADWEVRLFRILSESASILTPLDTVTSTRSSKRHALALEPLRFSTIEVPPPHAVDFAMRLQKQNKLPNLVAQNSHFFDPLPLVFGSVSDVVEASLLHLELKVNPLLDKWTCRTGDTLVLYMENTYETAQALANTLNFKLLQWIQAVPVTGVPFKHPFPTPCTVLDVLTKYYECATVSQCVIAALAPYVVNLTERELFEVLASDKEAFEARVVSPKLSLYGLLLLCPSIVLSLDIFLHVIPSMQPRYLTVMSFHEATVGLYLDVPPTPDDISSLETHSGALHAYFNALAAKKERAVRLAKAAKHSLMATVDASQYLLQALMLPARFAGGDRTQPLVLIAANSGLQPILTLLRERLRPPAATGHHSLFYNCKNQDFLPYINEVEGWTDDIGLTLVVASPPEIKATSFETLSDALRAHMLMVLESVDQQQGRVYVCGKTSFLDDIRQTLLVGKRMQLQRDDGSAEAWFAELLEQDRYVESTRG